MRRAIPICLVLLFALPALAGALQSLLWLEGTWERKSPRGTVYESWRLLSDRTFEGRSWREVPGSEPREGESMLLAAMGDEVFYIPRPAENAYPVGFKLVEVTESRAVFENPGHDFPQRIGYERNADGSMTAWIEGPGEAGESRRIDFPFRRVKAESPAAAR